MTEEKDTPGGEKKCLICQKTSQERVLLHGLEEGREIWVCVRCLPVLIHGAH
ncbi:MAG: hypothetical protein HY670_07520 [Chloroflexi bacterium]|nr:hypothetical protein [Chloroflexota bacterium]